MENSRLKELKASELQEVNGGGLGGLFLGVAIGVGLWYLINKVFD